MGEEVTDEVIFANFGRRAILNVPNGVAQSVEIVSYTHLDVYKRQVSICCSIFSSLGMAGAIVVCAVAVSTNPDRAKDKINFLLMVVTVSYTHLHQGYRYRYG